MTDDKRIEQVTLDVGGLAHRVFMGTAPDTIVNRQLRAAKARLLSAHVAVKYGRSKRRREAERIARALDGSPSSLLDRLRETVKNWRLAR